MTLHIAPDGPDADGPPAPPAGLGPGGAVLWRSIVEPFELRADELVVLEAACREVDLIRRLEEELDGADLTVKGSMGQEVAHPMVAELRMHRSTLTQLLKALRVTDDDDAGKLNASEAGRRAALARWNRQRGAR